MDAPEGTAKAIFYRFYPSKNLYILKGYSWVCVEIDIRMLVQDTAKWKEYAPLFLHPGKEER